MAKNGMSPRILVLTSLAGGPKHGYALLEDIAAMIGMRLGPGTLYGAIGWLEEAGWIEAIASDDRRRPYRLTESGSQALHAELSRYQRIVHLGLHRLQEVPL